jgi:pimeloyl-ACP methyl ester carboxylesterase
MFMDSHFIIKGNSKFHYKRFGNGANWVFCFHGYGEEGERFDILEPYLAEQFTLIAIDIPFHGKTEWNGDLLFKADELIELLNKIMGDEHKKFTLLGYSMGGRIAMKLFELMPHRVLKMVLVAPDGLHQNKWQWFVTKTKLGNRLFKYTMYNPNWIFNLIQFAEKFNLMNKSIIKFIHYYFDDPVERANLYKIWTTTRQYRPNLRGVKKLLISHQVPVNILFGKHDRIIITKRGIQFKKGLENLVTVHELDAGHQLLQKKYANDIASFF